MSFGWKNPLPFKIGGGLTPTEEIYAALRSARGEGGNPPEGGLQDLWDRSRAKMIAAGQSAVLRAVLQAFPQTMVDHLPVWEKILKIPELPTVAERQIAVALALTGIINATTPGLDESLKKIDPAFVVEYLPWDESASTVHGKCFEGLPGTTPEPFGTGPAAARKSTALPNYSTGFVVHVRYLLSGGQTEPPAASLSAAVDLLNKQLPFFVGFELYALTSGGEGDGFYLDGGDDDTSRFDVTGL